MDKCGWKLINPSKFVMGQSAERCGEIADVVVLRPNRKTDLYLCEEHINDFISHWGLYNRIEILCRCEEEPIDPPPAKLVVDPNLFTEIIRP